MSETAWRNLCRFCFNRIFRKVECCQKKSLEKVYTFLGNSLEKVAYDAMFIFAAANEIWCRNDKSNHGLWNGDCKMPDETF